MMAGVRRKSGRLQHVSYDVNEPDESARQMLPRPVKELANLILELGWGDVHCTSL
jgi:hypothetical protein